MGYPIFVIHTGGYPGASNPVENVRKHFFYDDKFVFVGTDGGIGFLDFSEVKQMPWYAVGGLFFHDLIQGSIEPFSGGRIYALMSMAAQRELTSMGISNPRAKSDQAEIMRSFYDNFIEFFGKDYKKELARQLKEPIPREDIEKIREELEGGKLPVSRAKKKKSKKKKSKAKKVAHSVNADPYDVDEGPYDVIHEQQLVENVDVQEAADRNGVSEATIRKWLNEGELPGYKDGNRWIIPVYSDEILSVKEASKIFDASPAKIRDWLSSGLIAGYKDEKNRWCVYAPDE